MNGYATVGAVVPDMAERDIPLGSADITTSHQHAAAATAGTTIAAAADSSTHDGSSSSTAAAPRVVRAPFVPTKQLGEYVVVLRNVSKHYRLGKREEVVHALKCINLVPPNEDDEEEEEEHKNGDSRSDQRRRTSATNSSSLNQSLSASAADSSSSSSSSSSIPSSVSTKSMPPIRRGEFVIIRGPSGGGKTTLLNLLGTIDEPSSGTIEIFGQKVDAKSPDKFLANLRLNKIGFVFQTFNLLATMSAFENVELPMIMKGKLSSDESRARALHLLDLVGLQDRYSHLPSELSGGEQQRVTIARALANDPELLLLDEPTGDLDSRNTVDVMNLILSINLGHLAGEPNSPSSPSPSSPNSSRPGTTIIMVTHNPDLECYADRILYVEDGRFKKQIYNRKQRKINFEKYFAFINAPTKQ